MPTDVMHFDNFASAGVSGAVVFEASHTGVNIHSHDFYELVLIQTGFCLHESANGATLLVEGDLFLLPPGVKHRYAGPHRITLFNCLFVKRALSGILEGLNGIPVLRDVFSESACAAPPKLHLNLDENKRFTRLFKQMISDEQEKKTGWEARMRCQLGCVLIDFARAYERHASAPDNKSPYPNYVVSALGIITARYSDSRLTVGEIAEKTGVTPDYLTRQFRVLTGVGVQEYLRRFRFAKATELLIGGMSVGDVALNVGFASVCHFSREFKKELGVTPSAYARENN